VAVSTQSVTAINAPRRPGRLSVNPRSIRPSPQHQPATRGNLTMPAKGLSLVQLTPEQQRARLRRRRDIEQALRCEYHAASTEFEQVIAMHLPGRVQQAYNHYVEAAVRLENFLTTGDIREHKNSWGVGSPWYRRPSKLRR
jgi:hypothetical protein